MSDVTSDRLFMVGRVTAAVFILAAGIAFWWGRSSAPERQAETKAQAASSDGHLQVSAAVLEARAMWARDNGVTSQLPAPNPRYALPTIPGGRLVWSKVSDGGTAWGYVTESSSREVGVAVLSHYQDLGGWQLDAAEMLDLSETAWAGIVSKRSTGESVIVVSLPAKLGIKAGPENASRVSILHMNAGELLNSVQSEAKQ